VDECATINVVVTFPADCEVGVGFLEVDGLGVPISGKSCSEVVGGVQHPGVSSLGRKEHQRADGDKAGVICSGPALNVLDLLGEAKLLARHRLLCRSFLDLFTVHVVLQSPVESSSHGTIHEALRRVAGLCIPLLRSNRHQRLLERIVSARASGSFLSPDPRSSNPEQGSAQPAYQLLSELGGSFCQESQHPHRVGPKRCPERGSRPALVAPDAQEGLLWSLFHFQEHGTRADLPDQRAEASYKRPQPPDPGASTQPLHALLLLYLR